MSDFVRVKHPLFGEYSARRPNLNEVEIVDKPAVDANGRPLPAKPKVSIASKATEKSKTPTNGAEPAATPEKDSEK